MNKPLQAILVVFVMVWSGLAFADPGEEKKAEEEKTDKPTKTPPTLTIDPSVFTPFLDDVQKLNEAKTKAEVAKVEAEAEAKEAKKESKELEQKLVDAEAEKKALELLHHSGVSIGASFIVASASTIKADKPDELRQVRPGAMPYVLMLPAYWKNKPETNVYCANRHRGLKADEVDKVTAAAAYKRARVYFEHYIEPAQSKEELTRALGVINDSNAQLHNSEDDEGATKTKRAIRAEKRRKKRSKKADEPSSVWDKHQIDALFVYLETYKRGLKGDAQSPEKIASDAALKLILLEISKNVISWKPAVATKCRRHRLGVFVGVPVLSQPFTRSVVEEQDQVVDVETGMDEDGMPITTPMNVTTESTRTVETRPFVAVGGAFSPNRFMALLAGVTIQNPGPSDPGHLARFGFMVGVSFQRDVMGSVFGYE